MKMNPYFGVIRYDATTPDNRQLVFQSSLVMEAAHKVAKLNDTAPPPIRYQLTRLSVRQSASSV